MGGVVALERVRSDRAMPQNGAGATDASAELERELSSAEAYDDGFAPRSCTRAGRLLRQPASPTLPAGMTVMQGAVDPALALEAYEYTSALGQPWGTYLTLTGESAPGELELQRIGAEPEVESLAARLLASFWRRGAAQLCGADLEHVHGFSVWAVVGDVGFKTAYHLDYAEVFRHKTNVIRPPLHAATLQVSWITWRSPFLIEAATLSGSHVIT